MTSHNNNWMMPTRQPPRVFLSRVPNQYSYPYVSQPFGPRVPINPQNNYRQTMVQLTNQQKPIVQLNEIRQLNKNHAPSLWYHPQINGQINGFQTENRFQHEGSQMNQTAEVMGSKIQYPNWQSTESEINLIDDDEEDVREWIDWSELNVKEHPVSEQDKNNLLKPVVGKKIEMEDWAELNVKEEIYPNENITRNGECIKIEDSDTEINESLDKKHKETKSETFKIETVQKEKNSDETQTSKLDGNEKFKCEQGEMEDWTELNVKEEIDPVKNTIGDEKCIIIEDSQKKTDENETKLHKETKSETAEVEPTHEENVDKTQACKSDGNEKFKCDNCSYRTNWKGNLTKHVISRHTALDKINWFGCAHCPYKGKTRDYLKLHLAIAHDKIRKWHNCPHCSYRSKLKNSVDSHILVRHTEAEKIKWFQCEKCPYKGKFEASLKQHVANQHTKPCDIKWFKCEHCPYKSKFKKGVKKHVLNKHTAEDKIRWFQCQFCSYKSKRNRYLQDHVQALHTEEGRLTKAAKSGSREIPVFIENKLYFKRILVNHAVADFSFKCGHCSFCSLNKQEFRQHMWKHNYL